MAMEKSAPRARRSRRLVGRGAAVLPCGPRTPIRGLRRNLSSSPDPGLDGVQMSRITKARLLMHGCFRTLPRAVREHPIMIERRVGRKMWGGRVTFSDFRSASIPAGPLPARPRRRRGSLSSVSARERGGRPRYLPRRHPIAERALATGVTEFPNEVVDLPSRLHSSRMPCRSPESVPGKGLRMAPMGTGCQNGSQ